MTILVHLYDCCTEINAVRGRQIYTAFSTRVVDVFIATLYFHFLLSIVLMHLPSLRRVVNSTSGAMNKLQNVQICADFYDRTVNEFFPDRRVVDLNSILRKKKKSHHEIQEHK